MTHSNWEISEVTSGNEFLRVIDETLTKIPFPEEWPPAIEAGNNRVVAARIGQLAIGWASVRAIGVREDHVAVSEVLRSIFPPEEGMIMPIHYVEVHPDYRGQGVGTDLIGNSENFIRNTDRPNVAMATGLWVDTENKEAIAFYKSLKYQPRQTVALEAAPVFNEETGDWESEAISAVVMTKNL
jgi:ribosomal protein S18 acetylase RimI-like enzyme